MRAQVVLTNKAVSPPQRREEPPELATRNREAEKSGLPASPAWNFAATPLSAPPPSRSNLRIGSVNDPLERGADEVADRVLRMPDTQAVTAGHHAPQVQRKCSACEEEEEHSKLARKEISSTPPTEFAPPAVTSVLEQTGAPLEAEARAFFEPRFGFDFSQVRVHTGSQAAASARTIASRAYTHGDRIVFGAGEYAPFTGEGRRLLAHELAHVVQQDTKSGSSVRRQMAPNLHPTESADVAMERKYANGTAPKAQSCGRPSWCPAGFCSPYHSEELAKYYRAKKGGWIMAGIRAAVDSRVVPLWSEYLSGGSSTKTLTADFGKDFTASPSTLKATTFLVDELKKKLNAQPPFVAPDSSSSLDVKSLIPTAVAALDDDQSPYQMNFNIPKDIPGNLAGGLGKDQTACPAGAQPSPFNDQRLAKGTLDLTRKGYGSITASPSITYTVKDTIDLCPGDCGSVIEQFATIPLSQFEATGISGDVPFTVEFPAPSMPSFLVVAPEGPALPPAPKGP